MLRSYLTNRKQFVQIGTGKSSIKEVACGVPQGSVVGPLFFILYVNDLPSNGSSDVKLFADDTTIFERLPGSNVHAITQSVTFVDTWMKANKMKCNVDKSKAVIFTTSSSSLDLGQLDTVIKPHLKYLGIEIDEHLSFKDHIHKVKTKIFFCNYFVLRSRALLTRTRLLIYYRTYVKPNVQYGVLVYGCTAYSNLHEIFNVQKRIIRSLFSTQIR